MSGDSTVVGLVTIARHGDRSEFFQNPLNYQASQTTITPLGEAQEYQQGQYLRSIYLSNTSSSALSSLAADSVFNQSSFKAYADTGDEGGVIYDSAVALIQGLFPPTSAETILLANGSSIESPLGGYEYVPIASVPTQGDFSSYGFAVEGFSSCPAFTAANNALYNSSSFVAAEQEYAPLLATLSPLFNNQTLSLVNAYNIFDEINVRSIHNSTFLAQTTPSQLPIARFLANYHEAAVFSSSNASSIANIGFNSMAPGVLNALTSAANASQPIRWTHFEISYKPFISLFALTNVSLPDGNGLVDYASYVALEVRQNADGSQVVRFNFRNGTNNGDVATFAMFGNSGDTPLSQFVETLGATSISNLGQWCNTCNQTTLLGCSLINEVNTTQAQLAAMQASMSTGSCSGSSLTLADAGGIGAGVTLGVVFILLGLAALFGFISFGKSNKGSSVDSGSDHEK